ncbi:telomerase protein component 1, partial [Oxyura jamaicensis]|uniref:telomerase protein component 1 n=1 Tax=Oxyura jamaicensis TaxID=8884 RepID=UPI0015A50E9B
MALWEGLLSPDQAHIRPSGRGLTPPPPPPPPQASLVGALRQAPPPAPRRPRPRCLVAYHFAGARPDQADARVALAHLCAQLARLRGHAPPEDPAHPEGPRDHAHLADHATYRSLRLRLLSLLATPPRGFRLVLLVDDPAALHEGGVPRRDWLPASLPPRVTLVLSAAPPRPGHAPFAVGGAWHHLTLGPLPPGDRARLLEAELRRMGRSLEPDQVRRVLAKGGSRQPIYLKLLLAELCAFARHDDVTQALASAPPTLPGLLGRILQRLEERHGPALALSLAALDAAPHGLGEGQLLAVLGAGQRVGGASPTWAESVAAAGPAPCPAPHWALLRDLRWLLEACGAPLAAPGARLHLAGSPLAEAARAHLGAGPRRHFRGHAHATPQLARMLLAGKRRRG